MGTNAQIAGKLEEEYELWYLLRVLNQEDLRSLEEELLHLIANQVKLSPYNMIFAMLIVAAMIIQHIPDQPLIWGSWITLVLASQLYRRWRLPKLPMEEHRPVSERSAEVVRINLVCSVILALSFMAFPMFTPFEAALQTMLFLAMGVGTIVVVVGWPPYVFAHIVLGLIPLFALWAWSGIWGPAGGYGLALSAIGFSYSFTMWRFASRLYEINKEFFSNRSKLARALLAAEQSDAAKTRFLAAASHDLRQPIHSLSLLTAALGMQPLGERAKSITTSIAESVDALSTQFDSLLDVSKLDAGVVPVNNSDVDLTHLLERLSDSLKEQAESVGITIVVKCPPYALVNTDPGLLESVLRNLITNALSHNQDCKLLLSAKSTATDWQLTVEDTGEGIPLDAQQHIFEEFYQVNNPERDRSKGLGLGLPIVKRLAELMSLEMQFSSRPGEGTRFMFSLPFATGKIQTLPDDETPQVKFEDLQVLVLDDEHSVRDAMKEVLEALGAVVATAQDTNEALDMITRQSPDIALVDYRLRGNENGIKAVQKLRQKLPGLPAIIVSGDTTPQRIKEMKEAGLLLLSKPVNEEALRNGFALVLGRSEGIA
jgi:signal transduction histidine kinase